MPRDALSALFPHTAQAIHDAALLLQAAWVEAAQSGRFFRPGFGSYARGILSPESLEYPEDGDPLAALVTNIAAHARIIEEGAPAFSLPQAIRWAASPAAKINARGRRYISIPFRHAVPRTGGGITGNVQRQMMPQHVYTVAKRLLPGQRLTAGPSKGKAVHVRDLIPYVPRYAANVRPGYEHASVHEGLRKQGAKGHTAYMTWRTITEDSEGWNIPAKTGTHIAAIVAEDVTPAIVERVAAAAEQDILAMIDLQLREG
jgi:hypothetical protein